MKEIKLTQGKVALVDDEDFEELSKHEWYYTNAGYAARSARRPNGTRYQLYMHVQIIGEVEGLEIDHISGDKLGNRKNNLRHVTRAQNQSNSVSVGGSSQYKGVNWHDQNKKWLSRIGVDGKDVYLGCYKSEHDAARRYNEAAIKFFGEYARLNVVSI